MGNVYGAYDKPTAHVDKIETMDPPTLKDDNMRRLYILLIIAVNAYLQLSFSLEVAIAVFLFWRVAYNFGVGLCLHLQSTIGFFHHMQHANWFWLTASQVEGDVRKLPRDVQGWLLYRGLSFFVLTADGVAFVLMTIRHAEPFNQQALPQYGLGVLLIAIHIWVKGAALAQVGVYAYDYGDFFFRSTKSEFITNTGVYGAIPHPMYTVGYSGLYGAACITQSFTVLVLAVVAHTSQMLFLFAWEVPHMDRVWADGSSSAKKSK